MTSEGTPKMNRYVAVGFTVGILAGVWTWLSSEFNLITWIAFVTWALFFAVGGKAAAVVKIAPPFVTGILYGTIVILLATILHSAWVVPVGVGVIAFIMCAQANRKVLAIIPGAFVGAAVLFGTGGNWLGAGIAGLVGLGLGFLSEWSAGLLTKPRSKATKPSSATA